MHKSFETPGPVWLDIALPSGRIDVEATDTGTTDVTLDGPSELVDRATVELRGDELRVRVDGRRGLFLDFGGGDAFGLRIRCPEGSHLAVQSKSADVETSGQLQDVRVRTASGDVVLDRVGLAEVKSASGDLTVREAEGAVTVDTASGDVRVGRAGRLAANVVSGDLRVDSVEGNVRAGSVSGDVRIDAVAAGDVSIQAVSGDVQVGVRRGSLVHVDATTLSGDTRSELELDDAPASSEAGPAVELRIRTVSGDISVVRAAATPTPQEV